MLGEKKQLTFDKKKKKIPLGTKSSLLDRKKQDNQSTEKLCAFVSKFLNTEKT